MLVSTWVENHMRGRDDIWARARVQTDPPCFKLMSTGGCISRAAPGNYKLLGGTSELSSRIYDAEYYITSYTIKLSESVLSYIERRHCRFSSD